MPPPASSDTPTNDENLLNALRRPIVLSIDLIGRELKTQDSLKRALEQPSVYMKIQDAIQKQATLVLDPGAQPSYYASGDTAKKLSLNILQMAGAAEWDSIQKSDQFKLIDSSLNDLKTEFDKTPTGLLVNHHKPELILVGSALTLGAGFAQYHFRSNDSLAQIYATGVSAATSNIKLGQLTLGAGIPSFTPSNRSVTFATHGGYNFKILDTKLELGGKLANGELNQFNGKATLNVPLNDKLLSKLSFSAGAAAERSKPTGPYNWKYSLGIDGSSQDSKFSVGVMATDQNRNYSVMTTVKLHF
jgi:hypothetical protein